MSIVSVMKIIIGLGNPGEKYSKHRHNVGFMVLEAFAQKDGLHFVEKTIFDANMCQSSDFILAKPNTWMNDSGAAVKAITNQWSDHVVVIYDDVQISLGEVKCSFGRGSGGHNGVESIINHLGTKDFFRIRVGVRPVHEELLAKIAPPDGFEKFLLSPFAPFEKEKLEEGINLAIKIIEDLKKMDFEEVMNKYN